MKLMLEKIVENCLKYGINVETTLAEDNSIAYVVDGFSKSGTALLYVGDDAVICETRYDRIDHVLTFNDLAYIAYEWFCNYKDREPFDKPDPKWEIVFREMGIGTSKKRAEDDDLPF